MFLSASRCIAFKIQKSSSKKSKKREVNSKWMLGPEHPQDFLLPYNIIISSKGNVIFAEMLTAVNPVQFC